MKKFSNIKPSIYKINEDSDLVIGEIQTDETKEPVGGPSASYPIKTEESPIVGEECSDVVKLFSKLFESREMAHIYHLQVSGDEGSYSKHISLNEYYESLLEMVDELIEVYQGQHGIVDGYDIIDTSGTRSKEPIVYFEELSDYVKHSRKCISLEDTHLHSLLDNIVCLIYKTIYKLKFNK